MRLELYFRTGKVPPLGSIKDLVLRDYLVRTLKKEFLVNKLVIGSSMNVDPSSFNSDLTRYVNMQFFLEGHAEDIERRMKDQYEIIRRTTPILKRAEDGRAVVQGLKSHLLKKSG